MPDIVCDVCFHHCTIKEGGTGFCGARGNKEGRNVCLNYGKLTSLALDPIEKKPLSRFYPGTYILSVGSYGCNLACPFCQNHQISMARDSRGTQYVPAEELCAYALHHPGNIGIAFTYNEPLVSYEYILDCGRILQGTGKKIAVVSNGTCEQHILEKIMPYVDAMNIDLKGDEGFYRELNGDCQTVKNTIAYVYDKCHLEVTTLVVPGKNDSEAFIDEISSWLASLDKNIVLHLSRYFPKYHYTVEATDKTWLLHLCETAKKNLNYVQAGNIW